MAKYHELNFVNLEKNEVVETIYIDDDFFYYLAELYPLESNYLRIFLCFIQVTWILEG